MFRSWSLVQISHWKSQSRTCYTMADFCDRFNHSLEVFTIVDDKHNDDRAANKLLVEMCGKKDELIGKLWI